MNMSNAKPVGSTLLASCRLFGKQSLKTKAEKANMMKIPYASAAGYVVGVVSRFMSIPEESTGRP